MTRRDGHKEGGIAASRSCTTPRHWHWRCTLDVAQGATACQRRWSCLIQVGTCAHTRHTVHAAAKGCLGTSAEPECWMPHVQSRRCLLLAPRLRYNLATFNGADSLTVHLPFVWHSVAALSDPSWFPVGTHFQPVYSTLIPSLPLDCASSWILVYFSLNTS